MVTEVSKECSATKSYNKGGGKVFVSMCSIHEREGSSYLNSVRYFVRIAT